jgi:hypothetical protein
MASEGGALVAGRAVVLPGTSRVDEVQVTGARLRSANGLDELVVAEGLVDASALVVADELLGRCVMTVRLSNGTDVEPTPENLRGLTIGDREALLLRIRQVTFGDVLDLVVSCADPACAAPMDLEVRLDELCRAQTPKRVPAEVVAGNVTVRLRPPTGADQAAVADQALDDPEGAGRRMARACILDPDPATVDDWLVDELGEALAELDPHADIRLALTCPECGTGFVAPLDAADLLRADLVARRRDLDVDVHLLALHYHWTEAAILALPSERRRRYLEVLCEARSPAPAWE